MAVSAPRENSPKKKKKGGAIFGGKGRRGIVRNVLTVICAIFLILCIFGFINQAAVGRSVFTWFVDRGTEVGNVLNSLVKQDDQSPVSITDEGIYVNGFEPEAATGLLPEANSNE